MEVNTDTYHGKNESLMCNIKSTKGIELDKSLSILKEPIIKKNTYFI